MLPMKYRKLGSSDLEVSEVSLGSWLTYGVASRPTRRGGARQGVRAGINFIDTANIYGRGAAETFLGEALQGRPRDSYVLATKLYFPMRTPTAACRGRRSKSSSMPRCKRLNTDYVDLYQCHRYDATRRWTRPWKR